MASALTDDDEYRYVVGFGGNAPGLTAGGGRGGDDIGESENISPDEIRSNGRDGDSDSNDDMESAEPTLLWR